MTEKIEKNMMRERAKPMKPITDEMWKEVNEHNRFIFNEYFASASDLSIDTIKQYKSALKIFFWWVNMTLGNIPLYKIKKRHFLQYMTFLTNHGLSSSGLNLKKYALSSLCNFVEMNIIDDRDFEKDYERFRHLTRGAKPVPKNKVYDKIPVTKEEYNKLIEILLEKENYLGLAWTATAFNVGARRSEITQFKTEILDYDFKVDSKGEEQNYILTHYVRGKGASRDGKPVRYMINNEALKYMKMWVEHRDYDSEYIFNTKYDGKIKPVSRSWANSFCQNVLSYIAGRRINPHLFKASCITYLLETGKSMKAVSKHVAQHNQTSTTENFYDLRSDEDEMNSIF